MINKSLLEGGFTTKWAGKTVHFLDEVTSTNDLGKELPLNEVPNGTIIITNYQNKGKGRLGRKWQCKKNEGLMFSLILQPEIKSENCSKITLIMGLAVAKAINEIGLEAQIKWPNDIVVNKKKLCGILTEMILKNNRPERVIIGVGINVHTREFPEEIKDIATSIDLQIGKKIDRLYLLDLLLNNFEKCYDRFLETEDLRFLRDEYNGMLSNIGKEIVVMDKAPYNAICFGIDNDGGLLVNHNNKIKKISTGEISIRGVFGYQ